MVHLTYEQQKELENPLALFLKRRPVDIPLTVSGELVFDSLEVYRISEQDREDHDFFIGDAPATAVCAINFVQKLKDSTEEWHVAQGEMYFNPDLTFKVTKQFQESTPLQKYLKKQLDEFLPTIAAMFDETTREESARRFAESIHEELVANVQHPSRMAAWWEELD